MRLTRPTVVGLVAGAIFAFTIAFFRPRPMLGQGDQQLHVGQGLMTR